MLILNLNYFLSYHYLNLVNIISKTLLKSKPTFGLEPWRRHSLDFFFFGVKETFLLCSLPLEKGKLKNLGVPKYYYETERISKTILFDTFYKSMHFAKNKNNKQKQENNSKEF